MPVTEIGLKLQIRLNFSLREFQVARFGFAMCLNWNLLESEFKSSRLRHNGS